MREVQQAPRLLTGGDLSERKPKRKKPRRVTGALCWTQFQLLSFAYTMGAPMSSGPEETPNNDNSCTDCQIDGLGGVGEHPQHFIDHHSLSFVSGRNIKPITLKNGEVSHSRKIEALPHSGCRNSYSL